MTTTRFLTGTVLAVVTAASSWRSRGMIRSATPGGDLLIPSVQPLDQEPIIRPPAARRPRCRRAGLAPP